MFSARRSYVATAQARFTEKLTSEENEQVNIAKENIIRQFPRTESKKQVSRTTTVRSKRFPSCLSIDCDKHRWNQMEGITKYKVGSSYISSLAN